MIIKKLIEISRELIIKIDAYFEKKLNDFFLEIYQYKDYLELEFKEFMRIMEEIIIYIIMMYMIIMISKSNFQSQYWFYVKYK